MTLASGVSRSVASILLAVMLVSSASAGAGAVTDKATQTNETSATGSETPEVVSVTEKGDEFTVVFDTGVENSTTGKSLAATDGEFVISIRPLFSNHFTSYEAPTEHVSVTGSDSSGEYRFHIDKRAYPSYNYVISPAYEVKIHVGEVRSAAASGDGQVADIGSVTADLSGDEIEENGSSHTSPQTADRVFQRTSVLFEADSENTSLLVRNVETGEILLDGSTGVNSRKTVFPTDALEVGTTYELVFDDGNDTTTKYFNGTSLWTSISLEEDGQTFEPGENVTLSVSGRTRYALSRVWVVARGPSDFGGGWDVERGELDGSFDYGTRPAAGHYEVKVINEPTGVSTTVGNLTIEGSPLEGTPGDYDADNNGTISDAELQAAIGDWATGGLDDSGLQAVILAWVSG